VKIFLFAVENISQLVNEPARDSKQEVCVGVLLFTRIQMHLPIHHDRNTFPALRTELFLSGLGSLPSDFVSGFSSSPRGSLPSN
jgi:hypothetical protein